ncbi:MAG: outer membrane protein [Candidatus Sulfotelmatobacter sp.]
MKTLISPAIILIFLAMSSSAQEVRNEVTVQGSGFFQKQTTSDGITNEPTNSGGVMAGYRFNLNHWFAVEGDYDYFRNHESFLSSGGSTLMWTNVHAATGATIFKLPSFEMPAVKVVSPFLLAGGGAMFFDPRRSAANNEQTRGAFVYGGGCDVPISKNVALRAEYRGFVYKIPDFEMTSLKVDKYTHSAVPSVGLVFTF